MHHFEPKHTAPLVLGDDGTIRIVGSRIPLDTIVYQFKAGSSAEQIQEDFPSLDLREIYGAISYYLDHTSEIEEYLKERDVEAKKIQLEIEARVDTSELRRRIRERRNQLIK